MLKLKEKLMEFCEGNVGTYSKSNNLPNMSSILMGFWKTKQTQQQQKTNIQNKQTNLIEIEQTLNQETTWSLVSSDVSTFISTLVFSLVSISSRGLTNSTCSPRKKIGKK